MTTFAKHNIPEIEKGLLEFEKGLEIDEFKTPRTVAIKGQKIMAQLAPKKTGGLRAGIRAGGFTKGRAKVISGTPVGSFNAFPYHLWVNVIGGFKRIKLFGLQSHNLMYEETNFAGVPRYFFVTADLLRKVFMKTLTVDVEIRTKKFNRGQ